MALTLKDIAQEYLADEEFLRRRSELTEKRKATLPALQGVIAGFVREESNLQEFRRQLEGVLRTGEDWGALGTGFMMGMNKLVKYHSETSSEPEIQFRSMLTGLNAENEGQRIEQCYNFLTNEQKRLSREGKSSQMNVAPGNSAFSISLFTFWLDPTEDVIIYYVSVRQGLYLLLKKHVLEELHLGVRLGNKAVEVTAANDHQACKYLVQSIKEAVPELATDAFWIERFLYWVKNRYEKTDTITKDIEKGDLLASTLQKSKVKETDEEYQAGLSPQAGTESIETGLTNDPLKPTPEPLLTRLIHEVQRSILVDEAVVKRIYHALLAGHVILTGPPGTGKTELARLIPETLWKSEVKAADLALQGLEEVVETAPELTTDTAYTTRLVTATDEWSVRTLISGITPVSQNGAISYKMQYGHLTATILNNWSQRELKEWSDVTLRRTRVTTTSGIERGTPQSFKGQWLVIDEFNRAPIDLALGDALTALGGHDVLRVAIEGGSAELPIPKDFRLIGTLNSFDRHYLNQISEALKRRFTFIEILPPARAMREAEQSIVLYKALQKIHHLSDTIEPGEEGNLGWQDTVMISPEAGGYYVIAWDNEQNAFRAAFEAAWRILEVIRIFRQLGTAQAISLLRQMLIAGVLQDYKTREQWLHALDNALCDTLADQLQVLLPDEVDALLLYLTNDQASFQQAYNRLLGDLSGTQSRLYKHLLALSSITNDAGEPFLSDKQIEEILAQGQPEIPAALLNRLFHLEHERAGLPQFSRRLRSFKAERGL